MTVIPITPQDIAAGRALRTSFAQFWATEQGTPREVYDRFVAATPLVPGATVTAVQDDPGPGIWVRPDTLTDDEAADDTAVLFLHGGGYGLGSVSAYAGFVSQFATRATVATFALEYPLAPETRFPGALDLAVATLDRLAQRYRSVAVVGESAGGGLALATVAEVVARGGIDVAGVAVFSPWTDLSLSGASVAEHAVGDPLLDPEYLRQSAAAYLGGAAPDDPRASPLFGAPNGLPPLLIQVGTDEILLDDSRRYADAVRAAGGHVQLEVWQGMHHVFQLNVEQLAAARRALDRAADFVGRRLDEAWDRQLRRA
jgi:epsilon-lactone hydrolase